MGKGDRDRKRERYLLVESSAQMSAMAGTGPDKRLELETQPVSGTHLLHPSPLPPRVMH